MFTKEELITIKSCLLSTKEILKFSIFKKQNIKDKILEIDNILKKIEEGS